VNLLLTFDVIESRGKEDLRYEVIMRRKIDVNESAEYQPNLTQLSDLNDGIIRYSPRERGPFIY